MIPYADSLPRHSRHERTHLSRRESQNKPERTADSKPHQRGSACTFEPKHAGWRDWRGCTPLCTNERYRRARANPRAGPASEPAKGTRAHIRSGCCHCAPQGIQGCPPFCTNERCRRARSNPSGGPAGGPAKGTRATVRSGCRHRVPQGTQSCTPFCTNERCRRARSNPSAGPAGEPAKRTRATVRSGCRHCASQGTFSLQRRFQRIDDLPVADERPSLSGFLRAAMARPAGHSGRRPGTLRQLERSLRSGM